MDETLSPLDFDSLRTLSEEEIARTLQIPEGKIADFARTIMQNPTSTIEPPSVRADSLGRAALAGLGAQTGARDITGGLELDKTIGEGGMGIVRLATQRSLGRKVAVKTLRTGLRTDDATLRLLREAWVTGSLEHPNIVPVYDLGLDAEGSPIIILKRIEGVEWASLINDGAAVKERFGATDLLEYNLRILIQLCNAVSLAHAKRVLHRDLKPENVMIGRFGEVYLVDWGIAVSLVPDPSGRLPLASEAKEMAGTPAYMAPEMLGAMGTLAEQTDVYLLGAILFEILTGAPPHRGANFREMVVSILLSNPDLPRHVPPELADITKKAMSREAAERFQTAEALRGKLEWYLRHRGSLVLSSEAARRLFEMRTLVTTAGDVESRNRLYQLSSEARFGFRQALNACEDNAAASIGLREAIERMIAYELDKGTPEAAAAALAELENPSPELTERVREGLALREEEKKRHAVLEAMGTELDPSIGRRTRLGVSLILASIWTVMPMVTGELYKRWPDVPRQVMYLWSVGILAICALVVRWGRESLWKTAVNRRIIAAGMIMFAAQFLLEVGGNVLGLGIVKTAVLHIFVWFFTTAVVAAFIDKKIWFGVVGMGIGFFVAAVNPAWVWFTMSAVNLLLCLTFRYAWTRPDEDKAYAQARFRREMDSLRGRFK